MGIPSVMKYVMRVLGKPSTNGVIYRGSPGNDLINGSAGGDVINGAGGDDVLNGLGGDDMLSGDAGNDTMAGGAGDDSYWVSEVGDVVRENPGEGNDTIWTTLNNYALSNTWEVENLTFNGVGNFVGSGNNLNNVIQGGAGNDQLSGGGNDQLVGGAGNDTLAGGAGIDSVDYGNVFAVGRVEADLSTGKARKVMGGITFIDTLSGIENLNGTASDDRLTGDGNSNSLYGGAGNDTLNGGGGNDWLDGNAGNDIMAGGMGDDVYTVADAGDVVQEARGEGVDSIWTSLNSYALSDVSEVENLAFNGVGGFIGSGNGLGNQMQGGAGNDRLNGGGGNDVLYAGGGSDTLDGGVGIDAADYSSGSVTGSIVANLDTGRVVKRVGAGTLSDTLISIENLVGTALSDSLTGDGNNNSLAGGAGADSLAGGGGNDIVNGGDGNDEIRQDMGLFNDTLDGGADIDTLVYSSSGMAGRIVANLALGKVDKVTAGTNVNVGAAGRYIRIYHTDATQQLTLTGLKVFAGGVDVAAGNTRVMVGSDTGIAGGAAYNNAAALTDSAVGGAWNYGVYGASNLTYVTGAKPYIQLDLGSVQSIDSISLWGHTNAPGNSNNLRIFISTTELFPTAMTYSSLTTASIPGSGVTRVDVATVETVSSRTFTDTVAGIENLTGTALNDNLTGDGNNNVLYGKAGNDTLDGGAGNDILAGEDGADSINGGDGNDTISQDMSPFADTLAGGAGVDMVEYAGAAGSITANLAAGVVSKTLASGTFNDTVSGIEGVAGTMFNDKLVGDANANTLVGESGDDTLIGGAGSDHLNGGDGKDVIVQDISPFADILNGGGDFDTVDYSAMGTAGSIVANLYNGTVAKRMVAGTYTDVVLKIENVIGTALNDSMTGDAGDNVFTGGAGNDVLDGGAGNDTLVGGGGVDTIIAGEGNDVIVQDIGKFADTLMGGAGVDTADYSTGGTAGSIVASLATGRVEKVVSGTHVNIQAVGRYVRIYRSDLPTSGIIIPTTENILSLTGMKVYENGVDVAAGKRSSAGADGGASLIGIESRNNSSALTDDAVGGAWNGLWSSASNLAQAKTSVVSGLTRPYIELDLKDYRFIDSIALWGRADAPAESNNLRVYVSTTPFNASATYASLAQDAGVVRADVGSTTETAPSTSFTDSLSGIENLVGTALNDSLTGDANANTLTGGMGSDTLAGGLGSDTYLFERGDGADVVRENDLMAGNKDVLRFGSYINPYQVWLRKVNAGKDLELSVIGSNDRVTISNWYAGPASHVEEIYAGGRRLLDTNVDKLVNAMAAFAPPAAGQTALPASLQTALAPVIAANWSMV